MSRGSSAVTGGVASGYRSPAGSRERRKPRAARVMLRILTNAGVKGRAFRALLGPPAPAWPSADTKARQRVRSDVQRWLVLHTLVEGFEEREIALLTGLAPKTVALRLGELRADLGTFRKLLWQRTRNGGEQPLAPLSWSRKQDLLKLAEALESQRLTVPVSMVKLLARVDPWTCADLLEALSRAVARPAGEATPGPGRGATPGACAAAHGLHASRPGSTIGSER